MVAVRRVTARLAPLGTLGYAFDEDGVNYYMLLASRLILLALCRAVI